MGDLFLEKSAATSDNTEKNQELTFESEKQKDELKMEERLVKEKAILEEKKSEKVYSHEEVIEASKKYFKGDNLAAVVWANKYALKDSYGNLFEKSPEDMHRRLSGEIARIEKNYANPISEERIYEVLKDFKYIVPQGGPMTGIGNPFQIASLSNCFVIGNDGNSDSYGGIQGRPGAGAIDETTGWCRTRLIAYQTSGFAGIKQCTNLNRCCSIYGALF